MRGSEVYLWNSSLINSVCLVWVYPESHCRTPVQKLFGDHFGVEEKKSGDLFVVGIISGSIWGSFWGRGSFQGRDHFGGCILTVTLACDGHIRRTLGLETRFGGWVFIWYRYDFHIIESSDWWAVPIPPPPTTSNRVAVSVSPGNGNCSKRTEQKHF